MRLVGQNEHPVEAADDGREGCVLLVDDERGIRRAYGTILRRAGFQVVEAADGNDALAQLAAHAVDVIITDLMMPSLDGMQFLRQLRGRDPEVPVILMTGVPRLATAAEAVECGAFRYLVKPVDPGALTHTAQCAVDAHRGVHRRRVAADVAARAGFPLEEYQRLEATFERAVDGLWMAYQPVVAWAERRVVGYEALVRSHEPQLAGAVELLAAAGRLGRVHDLGRCVRRRVAEDAASVPGELVIFVNVCSEELSDNDMVSATAPLHALAQRVVLDITERVALDGVTDLSPRLSRLRARGYRVAIDDMGAGHGALASFAKLEPEFVKLDASLIRGLEASSRRRTIVSGIASLFGRDLGAEIICEAVETAAERDALAAMGLDMFQGHLFGRASAGFPPPCF